jgi:hypothetical protein
MATAASFLAMTVPLVAGLIAGHFTSRGNRINLEAYRALGEAIPVLLVGAVVEMGLSLSRLVRDQGLTETVRAYIRGVCRTYLASAILGEGAVIYALARQQSSTFLFTTAVTAALMIVWDLTTSSDFKFGLRPFALETASNKLRDRLLRAADRRRRKAARLLTQAEEIERGFGAGDQPQTSAAVTSDDQQDQRSPDN